MATMAITESQKIIFNRAVNFVIPKAIPTHYDRSSEFALGDVLIYEHKLRPLMPWRKHHLVFTGYNLSKMLKEPVELNPSTEVTFDNASTKRSFGVSAKVDTEITYAIAAHFGVKVAESETATMSVDFGKVERHYTDLNSLLLDHKCHADLAHPVIEDAMRNNKTIFIINSLYVAEKTHVGLNFTAGASDGENGDKAIKQQTTSPQVPYSQPMPPIQPLPTYQPTGGSVPVVVGQPPLSEDFEFTFHRAGESVIQRDQPTNVAYRVVRVKLDGQGLLRPKLRTCVKHTEVKVLDETDSVDTDQYTYDRFDVMAAREEEPN